MGVKVTFTDKSGKPGSLTFPNHTLAQRYAAVVKNATFSLTEEHVEVEVVKCGSKGQEEYKRRQRRLLEEDTSEQDAEAYMEAGVQARLMGADTSEALVAAAWSTTNVRASEVEVVNMCACGNKCLKGLTSCYICRRYG